MSDKLNRAMQSAAANGVGTKIVEMIRRNPTTAAVLSKLNTAREKSQFGSDGSKNVTTPDTFHLKQISQDIAMRNKEAETILQMLPDLELSAQILIASIMSPKDMTTTELTYQGPEGIFTSEMSMTLTARIRQYFEQTYKIKPLLPLILRDVLFRTGSYPICVIPENSLDDMINHHGRISMESINGFINKEGEMLSLGILGEGRTGEEKKLKCGIAVESLSMSLSANRRQVNPKIMFGDDDINVSVSDNPDMLKVPLLNNRIRHQAVMERLGVRSLESYNQISDQEFTNIVYKSGDPTFKTMTSVKTDDQLHRKAIGEPLILSLPSESVMPAYVPGTPEKHIGYWVLIDGEGYPISARTNEDFYRQIGTNLSNGTRDFPSQMVSKVNQQLNTGETFNWRNQIHTQYAIRAYGEMVEADLLHRMKNGIYGDGVSIARNDEVYRLMLARTLAKQHTQLLFVPVELMTYFAMKYDDDGVGKSIIEDMKILLSQRIVLMFSNTMAAMRNSIGRTEVKLKLDENDPDPKTTIEKMINELVRTRQSGFPIGVNSPVDIVEFLQRASMEFTFEGHPGLPDVIIDIGEKNSNFAKPDTELEDSLRKRSIMACGLSPETVDNGFAAEFATSVVANNLLLAKRVMQIQEVFNPQLSSHARKVIINSQVLMDDLKSLLKEKENCLKSTSYPGMEPDKAMTKALYEFITGLEITLPQPNSVTIENQATALESYSKILEPALDAWISDKFFTSSTGGDVAGEIGTIREVLKAYFIRKWLAENGVLTELSALTASDEEGRPAVDFFKENVEHLESLTKSLTQFMIKLQPMIQASNTEMEARVGETDSGGGSSSGEESGGGGGEDDFDFDAGGMGGPDEATDTPTDNPPEEDPASTPGSTEEKPAGDETAADKPTEEKKDDAGGENKDESPVP